MSDDVKERILQAAKEMFSRYGLKKTSLAEVAEAARMGKSSLYYYFPSKEAIFHAVAEAEITTSHQQVLDAVARAKTPTDKLRAYMQTARKMMKQAASAYEVLFNEGIDHLEGVKELKRKAARQQEEHLAELIAEGEQQGAFKVDNLKGTARAIRLVLMSTEDMMRILHMDPQAERDLDLLTELLIRGLQA